MTDEEYEDLYCEALRCLAERFSVGQPFVRPDGMRVCSVDGILVEDEQVLKDWREEELVEKIRREYPRFGTKPKVRSICSE